MCVCALVYVCVPCLSPPSRVSYRIFFWGGGGEEVRKEGAPHV